MRIAIVAIAAWLVLGRGAEAQLVTSPAANPVGTWRGRSVCVVRQSACKDETVVFRIARRGTRDSLAVDGRKIVGGHEVEMGVLGCQLNASRGYFTCAIPSGTWRFRARHDSLIGQLRERDGTLFRNATAVREREGGQQPELR